ncbi:hypothetical protein [Pseudonocardia alni]|uniref:hypothetical protein n=1 Tax=Pseudonocardia alni TaxID=33907 RepID=UPI003331335E
MPELPTERPVEMGQVGEPEIGREPGEGTSVVGVGRRTGAVGQAQGHDRAPVDPAAVVVEVVQGADRDAEPGGDTGRPQVGAAQVGVDEAVHGGARGLTDLFRPVREILPRAEPGGENGDEGTLHRAAVVEGVDVLPRGGHGRADDGARSPCGVDPDAGDVVQVRYERFEPGPRDAEAEHPPLVGRVVAEVLEAVLAAPESARNGAMRRSI